MLEIKNMMNDETDPDKSKSYKDNSVLPINVEEAPDSREEELQELKTKFRNLVEANLKIRSQFHTEN